MSRFSTVLAGELRLAARDRVLPWLLAAFAVMALYGAWTGAQWRAERAQTVASVAAEIDEAMETRREQFAKAKPGEIPFAAMPQVTPFRPVLEPGALAALSIGQAEAYPYAARMLPLGDETIFDAFRVHVDNPAMKAAGRFDLALVIVMLMPLLLMAACYDFWVRDRERGVGAMMLAQPISPQTLLAARALSRVILAVLPMTVICVVALALFAGLNPGLIGVGVVVFVYGVFWIAVVLVVNVVVRRSTEAAVVCGVAWLIVTALGPALALAVVDIAWPAPSAIEKTNTLRSIGLVHRAELRARPPLVEPDPAPKIPERLRVFMVDTLRLEGLKAPVLARYDAALEARRDKLDVARAFLPSVAVQDALDRLAGSDAHRALGFQRQVIAFRGETRDWMAARFDADAPMALADYARIPRFRFSEPRQGLALFLDLAAMAAAAAVLLLAAFLTLRRRHPLEA